MSEAIEVSSSTADIEVSASLDDVTVEVATDLAIIEVPLQGPPGMGLPGEDGEDGNTILFGPDDPVAGIGVDGDWYINTTTHFMFGPKAGGVWPAGFSLIGPPVDTSTLVAKAGDTMTGHLGLPTGPSAGHAVRKDYVDASDTALASAVSDKVSKGGDTMTGHLSLPTGPAAANAVRKDYVDAADATLTTTVNGKVAKAGDTMTGFLTLHADPDAPMKAATKQYVDGLTGGANFVRIDADQGLTATQRAQGRENIYAAPLDALAFNGIQVNGTCWFDQVYCGVSHAGTGHALDMWLTSASGAWGFTSARTGNSPTGAYSHSIRLSLTSAIVPGVNDYLAIAHMIEGWRALRLNWGTATAQPITIGFWARSQRPGNVSLNITGENTGGAGTHSTYATTFNLAAADVWQWKTVTIPGPTSGTWEKTTTRSIIVYFTLAAGTNRVMGTDTWSSSGNIFLAANSHTNIAQDNDDYLEITGLVILPGIEAPLQDYSANVLRSYMEELKLCERYYEKTYNVETPPGAITQAGCCNINLVLTSGATWDSASRHGCMVQYKTPKRVTPNVLAYSTDTGASAKMRDVVGGGDVTPVMENVGTQNLSWTAPLLTTSRALALRGHFTLDARL